MAGVNGNGKKPNGKLTPQLQEQICALIQMGCYDHVAARAVGVHPATFYAWLAKGRAAKTGRYRLFADAVEVAQAMAEAAAVNAIRRAWERDWRAALAFLQRRHPTRWGRTDRLVLEGQVDHHLEGGNGNGGPRSLGALGLDERQVEELGRALAQRCTPALEHVEGDGQDNG